jgi:hypothetical protein
MSVSTQVLHMCDSTQAQDSLDVMNSVVVVVGGTLGQDLVAHALHIERWLLNDVFYIIGSWGRINITVVR